ncbi:MAG: imidazolonepropionase, partial [Pseudomonadota bacterium]
MRLLTNATLATMAAGPVPYGLVERGAVLIDGARIAWAGPAAERPAEAGGAVAEDLGGRLVTPG